MIGAGGEGEEGEKVDLKICLAGKLSVKGKSTDHYTKKDC